MTRPPDPSTERVGGEAFRAGFVALVGLPNVGKSTLLNELVGARLSIVTPKAQTTRQRLLGLYTDEAHQAAFIDTPGLLEPRYRLQEAMREEAAGALEDADVLVYVADLGYEPSLEGARSFRPPPETPALLCLNKADRADRAGRERLRAEFDADPSWAAVLATVATTGEGVEELRAAVLERLPPSPALYPPDELSTAPVRFFVAELVRETCFEVLAQEVPYAVAVRVDEFKDRGEGNRLYIAATLFVERNSQKGIVIGEKGARIREIGTASRRKIQTFLERPVYLDLRVKVLANWRKRDDRLRMLGFRPPPASRR